jgi:predicted transposase/invertase (TIGR01784 family)
MDEKLIVKPKLDVVFKLLFVEHPDLLKIFLSDALNMPEEDFAEIQILNPELLPDSVGEKYARLDIAIKKPDGTKINVELQNIDEHDFKERSVYYCSKMFTRDVFSGEDYVSIPKTICINIVQFPIFEDEDYICTVYPTIQESGKIVTDKWQIIYFQTPKLPANLSDDLTEWLKFFTIETEKELCDMLTNTHSTGVKKAINIVETMNEEDRYKTIAREREETMFNKALAMGAAMMYEREQGVLEGERNSSFKIARSLLKLGLTPAQIAQSTELSLETIYKIISENQT